MNSINLARLEGIENLDVTGKHVLLRADLNVPLADGSVSDPTRILRVVPTIQTLTDRGAKVVVLSHLGRPKGKLSSKLSLRPVADAMRAILGGTPVRFVEECVGPQAKTDIGELEEGEVALLENLRFHPGEEANDADFARDLGRLGDIYVNDAFSCSHRAHASIDTLATILPAYAGRLMVAEIMALRTVLDAPKHPVAAVIGGAKISTKIPVLTNLVDKVDLLIVGGGMANTFLHAVGVDVGKSLHEPDFAETAIEIMKRAKEAGCKIALPEDAVVAKKFEPGAVLGIFNIRHIPTDGMILDVGPETVARLIDKITHCKTLLWNGPLGAFEMEPFGKGTSALAHEAARLTKEDALVTVAGGGDTIAALNAAGVTDDFTYVSTAGGAFLEWIEGRELPGVVALVRNQENQLARSA